MIPCRQATKSGYPRNQFVAARLHGWVLPRSLLQKERRAHGEKSGETDGLYRSYDEI
jgi:hypothetical protein